MTNGTKRWNRLLTMTLDSSQEGATYIKKIYTQTIRESVRTMCKTSCVITSIPLFIMKPVISNFLVCRAFFSHLFSLMDNQQNKQRHTYNSTTKYAHYSIQDFIENSEHYRMYSNRLLTQKATLFSC